MGILPVIILAGGMGTRIASEYKKTPKALVPLLNRPFLAWKLDELQRQGVEQVILILGKGEGEIRNFIAENSYDIRITILSDGEILQGTAGAIRKQLNFLPDIFILTYGDNLLGFELEKLCTKYRETGLPVMVCTSHKGIGEKYNSAIKDGRVSRYSKTDSNGCDLVDYGYLVFRKRDFLKLPMEESVDLYYVIEKLIEANELVGIRTDLQYYEIGTPEGIKATENWLRQMEKQ